MTQCDVIIVGGGPAGSSCAWQLRRRGVECLILDKAHFPRLKLCAGWITPEVVADLEMDPATYPYRFLTFDVTQIHLYGLTAKQRAPQHSIRRYEFDDWLLRRSGAPFVQHDVRRIERRGDRYVIDNDGLSLSSPPHVWSQPSRALAIVDSPADPVEVELIHESVGASSSPR